MEVGGMAEFDVFHEYAEELEGQLRLRTYPLAVKLLKNEQDIPQETQRLRNWQIIAC